MTQTPSSVSPDVQEDLRVTLCERHMIQGVAQLQHEFYGETVERKAERLEHRFFHEYAHKDSFIVVSLAGTRVVGMGTANFWPYTFQGRTYFTLQWAQDLVHQDFRRRGLYGKMLALGYQTAQEKGVDFMTGFPTAMNYGGMVKNKWQHIGSPRWFIRVLRPLRIARRTAERWNEVPFALSERFRLDPEPGWGGEFKRAFNNGFFHMAHSPLSFEYHYAWQHNGYQFFRDDPADTKVIMVCRTQARHGFRELVVGDILVRDGGAKSSHVSRALGKLVGEAKRSRNIDAVSILINPAVRQFLPMIAANLFVPILKTLTYLVKGVRLPLTDPPAGVYAKWNLMNADIDTWTL